MERRRAWPTKDAKGSEANTSSAAAAAAPCIIGRNRGSSTCSAGPGPAAAANGWTMTSPRSTPVPGSASMTTTTAAKPAKKNTSESPPTNGATSAGPRSPRRSSRRCSALAGGAGGVSYPAAILYSHLGELVSLPRRHRRRQRLLRRRRSPNADSQRRNPDRMTRTESPGRTPLRRLRRHARLRRRPRLRRALPASASPKGLYGLRADDFTAVTQTTATTPVAGQPRLLERHRMQVRNTAPRPATAKTAECKALPGSGEKPVLASRGRHRPLPQHRIPLPGLHDQRQRHAPRTRHRAPHG